jgi:hypothetical protein
MRITHVDDRRMQEKENGERRAWKRHLAKKLLPPISEEKCAVFWIRIMSVFTLMNINLRNL